MKVYITGCCKVGYYTEGQWLANCPKCGRYNPKMTEDESELTYFDVSESPNEYPKKYTRGDEEE